MRNMCGEVGNQVPGSGSSPVSHGGVPATTGEDGVRNTDQGWTVFQITSTPATLLAVGSDSCGPDRARTRSSSQLSGRRARARARELDAAIAMAEVRRPSAGSSAEDAGDVASASIEDCPRVLWSLQSSVGPLARTSSSLPA